MSNWPPDYDTITDVHKTDVCVALEWARRNMPWQAQGHYSTYNLGHTPEGICLVITNPYWKEPKRGSPMPTGAEAVTKGMCEIIAREGWTKPEDHRGSKNRR